MQTRDDDTGMTKLRRPAPPPISGRIVVVGRCASGKSLLVDGLKPLGYDARSCAQEHSYVPDMWQRLSRPQFLVYLHASLQTIRQRRPAEYEQAYLCEQDRRLAHAREHCDLYVSTDALTPQQVLHLVLSALCDRGIHPAR